MIVVSDTSPIINLAIIGEINLLPQIFHRIIIPHAVFDEITVKGADMPGADEIREAKWVEVLHCQDQKLFQALKQLVDPGEAEAIVLALEIKADLLLLDERIGRRLALNYHLKILGLLGVLKIAKRKGYLTAVKPVLDKLIKDAGFRISLALYREIITDVGE
ncbi:MAG: DUF3368 domain-containing protein [Haliscomenobacteraceae bacterium CHB4]|nr:hypothetical protein [Saprospiraceae bacterium]MCE7923651.1 DUF3368 domain-containing protein [Haliscomenobacteraceae bacterium CHB4]